MQFFDEKEICVFFDEEFNNTILKSELFLHWQIILNIQI